MKMKNKAIILYLLILLTACASGVNFKHQSEKFRMEKNDFSNVKSMKVIVKFLWKDSRFKSLSLRKRRKLLMNILLDKMKESCKDKKLRALSKYVFSNVEYAYKELNKPSAIETEYHCD